MGKHLGDKVSVTCDINILIKVRLFYALKAHVAKANIPTV